MAQVHNKPSCLRVNSLSLGSTSIPHPSPSSLSHSTQAARGPKSYKRHKMTQMAQNDTNGTAAQQRFCSWQKLCHLMSAVTKGLKNKPQQHVMLYATATAKERGLCAELSLSWREMFLGCTILSGN